MGRLKYSGALALAIVAGALLIGSGCQESTGPVAKAAPAAAKQEVDTVDAPPSAVEETPAVEDGPPNANKNGKPAKPAEPDEEPMLEHPFPGTVKAPSLDGGVAWINTAGPLDIKDLRGKFVLLDFWTYCCINCMHILPELKKLEKAYPNEIVVIGVHSAKFETEEESQSITDAVLRYEIEHPVVNDANHEIWNRYRVNSWPSLRVIDPEGNLVAGDSGEVEFEMLDGFFKKVLPYYKKKGILDETPLRFDLATTSTKSPLRFPGKVLADEKSNRLFIADSNHNRLVITTLAGKLLDVIGSGVLGAADGDFAAASFNKPQGMALKDQTLYVADTENHLLRKIDLEKKQVSTIAGQGHQGRNAWRDIMTALGGNEIKLPDRWAAGPLKLPINSPWALAIHKDDLYVAMAGPHQIWKMPLDESEIGPYAGNGREDIVDGPLLPKQPYEEGFSSFAQPSGLASDGKWLYVADSEGSSIRAVPFDPDEEVKTIVGTSHLSGGRLFAFGDVDGTGESVRLQHVLGVTHHNGNLYVADTYNHKIKQINLEKQSVKTIAGNAKRGNGDDPAQFYEPAGISYAAGKLYVADTNNHLVRVINLDQGNKVATLVIEGLAAPTPPQPALQTSLPGGNQMELPVALVQPVDAQIRLAVKLNLPRGWKINTRAPMSYRVESESQEGPVDRAALGKPIKVAEPAAEFDIRLPVTAVGKDRLKVALTYYYCQEQAEGLCKVGSITWSLPMEVSPDADKTSTPLEWNIK